MKYKDFCGLKVSALGLGNMRLPTIGERGPIDREKAEEIIRHAYESGINYFDTAYRYHGGESETFVGEILSSYPRDSFYLATKFPGHMMTVSNGRISFKGYLSGHADCTVDDIFNEQLQKCKVDYFDFYLLHNVCESSYGFYTDDDLRIVEYFIRKKQEGKIRHLGFSSHGRAETIARFLDRYKGVFEFVQIELNYLDWTLQDAKSKYETISAHGLPVVVMEPVRGGRLINMPEKTLDILRSAEPDTTPAAWGFRFLQSLPDVGVVLSGMTKMEQLNENLTLFSDPRPLNKDELNVIDEAVKTLVNLIPCTGCRYCTEECPQHINIPKLIALYNEEKNGGGMLTFNMDRENPEEDPSRCISCGACKRICPQGIDIPSVMKAFSQLLSSKSH
jgi:predicted aldo/keto reductase-like oxidoreductase